MVFESLVSPSLWLPTVTIRRGMVKGTHTRGNTFRRLKAEARDWREFTTPPLSLRRRSLLCLVLVPLAKSEEELLPLGVKTIWFFLVLA